MVTSHTYRVRGMHCASCAGAIERALRHRAGVSTAEVSYVSGQAKIAFDETQVRPEELAQIIQPLGYSLVIEPAHDHAHAGMDTPDDSQGELAALRHKTLAALPVAGVALAIMAWHLLAEAGGVAAMPTAIHKFTLILLPILAIYVLAYTGRNYLQALGRFIRHGAANMDTLIGLGTVAAFGYSAVFSIFSPWLKKYLVASDGYYDVTIVVITFVTLGKYLETRARLRTGGALQSLLGLQAKTALVRREGREKEIPIGEVVAGDLLVVKPGVKIPVDGVVVEGASHVDESLISGEPTPVKKEPGALVVAGTMNTTGAFVFRATKIGGETLLAHIIQMVREAQSSKAPVQSLADKIAAVFVPAALGLAVVALVAWLALGSGTLGFAQAFAMGLSSFVCVLVIACPCALGLATPAAVTVGVGQAARAGILIKDAATLQKLGQANVIVLDKTGTLTRGRPELVEFRTLGNVSEESALALLAALEKNSEHPLAHAIANRAAEEKLSLPAVAAFEALKGRGVEGMINGEKYFAGSELLARERGFAPEALNLDEETRRGRSPVLLGSARGLLAVALVADAPKDSAKDAVARLRSLGIRVVMLTGDNENTARYIAQQVGLEEVAAQALPADKLAKIKELQAGGLVVAMAGDGVNDAPALALADVGIAMGDGADAAIETAGVVLLHGDIAKLAKAVSLSRQTMRVIRQNLFWAFAFNLIGLPLAAGLFYPWFGWLLSPMFAGVAMAFSSVLVVSNSLRLKLQAQ